MIQPLVFGELTGGFFMYKAGFRSDTLPRGASYRAAAASFNLYGYLFRLGLVLLRNRDLLDI